MKNLDNLNKDENLVSDEIEKDVSDEVKENISDEVKEDISNDIKDSNVVQIEIDNVKDNSDLIMDKNDDIISDEEHIDKEDEQLVINQELIEENKRLEKLQKEKNKKNLKIAKEEFRKSKKIYLAKKKEYKKAKKIYKNKKFSILSFIFKIVIFLILLVLLTFVVYLGNSKIVSNEVVLDLNAIQNYNIIFKNMKVDDISKTKISVKEYNRFLKIINKNNNNLRYDNLKQLYVVDENRFFLNTSISFSIDINDKSNISLKDIYVGNKYLKLNFLKYFYKINNLNKLYDFNDLLIFKNCDFKNDELYLDFEINYKNFEYLKDLLKKSINVEQYNDELLNFEQEYILKFVKDELKVSSAEFFVRYLKNENMIIELLSLMNNDQMINFVNELENFVYYKSAYDYSFIIDISKYKNELYKKDYEINKLKLELDEKDEKIDKISDELKKIEIDTKKDEKINDSETNNGENLEKQDLSVENNEN